MARIQRAIGLAGKDVDIEGHAASLPVDTCGGRYPWTILTSDTLGKSGPWTPAFAGVFGGEANPVLPP